MNRGALIRIAVLAAVATAAIAENALEIITLRHRTAEQVLPTLRPLLEPGATLTGQGNQLFVRTSPENLTDLRLALDVLDAPQRRLLISVRFDDAGDISNRSLSASGRIVGGGNSQVEVRAQDARSQSAERVDQRVQAVDGQRAMILTGASRPLRQRQYIQTPAGVVPQDITVVQEMTSGFEVIPRVTGDRVQVEVAQQRETAASYQRTGTTASGRLGEWFELGAVATSAVRDERGIASASTSAGSETRRVWIRVDELR